MSRTTDPRILRSRTAIVRATLELLAERGIAATTIEAVADRSGVAKTTIYRQWDSQAALVIDAFDSILRPPPDPDTGTLRGDLLNLLTGLAASLQTGPATSLMFALIDAAERDPAFAALHRRESKARHQIILDVIERGIVRGELPVGTAAEDVLDMLAGPILYRRAVSTGRVSIKFAERVVDHVLRASCHTSQA
jgi:AcrR family transcriptional regulator